MEGKTICMSVHADQMKENSVHPVCGILHYIVPCCDVAKNLRNWVLWLKVALCIVHREYSVNACMVLSVLKDLQCWLELASVIALGSAICSHFQSDVGRGKIRIVIKFNVTFVCLVLTCSRKERAPITCRTCRIFLEGSFHWNYFYC